MGNVKHTKAQITIILIAGLALLLIASFIVYVGASKAKAGTNQEKKKVLTTTQEAKPIKDYIQACFESVSGEALSLMGQQGGYLYKSQKGTFSDFDEGSAGAFFIPYQGRNVAYGIAARRAQLPNYPSLSSPYGPNPSSPVAAGNVQLLSMNGSSASLEYVLSEYTSNNFNTCLDEAFFEEKGFSLTAGERSVETIFGPHDTTFLLSEDLHFFNNATHEEFSLSSLEARHRVRIIALYTTTLLALNGDVSQFPSDLEPEQFPGGITLTIQRDAFGKDDILLFKDLLSSIGGKNYEFITARKNRNPGLHYLIRNPSYEYLPGNLGLNFSQGTIIDQDLLRMYLGEPFADDPDEDTLTYSFIVESSAEKPSLPQPLITPEMTIKIAASDGELEDYQLIPITRNPFS